MCVSTNLEWSHEKTEPMSFRSLSSNPKMGKGRTRIEKNATLTDLRQNLTDFFKFFQPKQRITDGVFKQKKCRCLHLSKVSICVVTTETKKPNNCPSSPTIKMKIELFQNYLTQYPNLHQSLNSKNDTLFRTEHF